MVMIKDDAEQIQRYATKHACNQWRTLEHEYDSIQIIMM